MAVHPFLNQNNEKKTSKNEKSQSHDFDLVRILKNWLDFMTCGTSLRYGNVTHVNIIFANVKVTLR